MKKILLLVNPNARSGNGAFTEISTALLEEGFQVYPKSEEERLQDCNYLIRKYKNEIDYVIIGGGDGSVNSVLSSLVETQIPLIVYPLGTANLLARSFEINANINELIELLKNGKVKAIDLGTVNGIYFINVCGLGISTEVNKTVSPILKKLTGPLSFWITGLKLSRNLKPFKMKLTVDNSEPVITRTWQITVCNGKKYAAWMTIEPDASYEDSLLHCLSTEIKKWWQGFRLLPSYFKGSYRDDLDVTLLKGRRIKIETKHSLQVDVDGDIQTKTPAVFEVRSKALKLIVK